jgi:SAM-dependent methyltransferase
MKYLTSKELLESEKDYTHDILEKCIGKSVRDSFAFKVFDTYLEKVFRNNKHNLKILDLGPASGGFAKQINDFGYINIYGTDLDDYLVKENRRVFLEFKKCDLSWEKIPWQDNFFDVVDAWCVLPHLENPFFCAREINRVLKKGGVFIFTTPFLTSKASMDFFRKNKDFGSYRTSNNHLVLFPAGVVSKSILKYFDVIDIEYHFRSKIFKGVRGKIRKFIYKIAKSIGDETRKRIAKRWAYNIVYILKKK